MSTNQHCASKIMNLILIKPVKHCCNVALFSLTPPSSPYIVFVSLQKAHTPSGSWWRVGVWKHPAVEPHSSCAIAGSRHSIWRTNPQGVSLMKTTGGCFSDGWRSAASLTDSVRERNFDATVLWKTKGTLLMISFVFNTNLRKQQSRVRLKN